LKIIKSPSIQLLVGKKLDQWWAYLLLLPLDRPIDTAFPLSWEKSYTAVTWFLEPH